LKETHRHGHFHTMERSSVHFLRRLKLPESVDASQLKVEFYEGVLRVTIPRAKKPTGEAAPMAAVNWQLSSPGTNPLLARVS
jgi:HSP20 family molecular chaperone IbpA